MPPGCPVVATACLIWSVNNKLFFLSSPPTRLALLCRSPTLPSLLNSPALPLNSVFLFLLLFSSLHQSLHSICVCLFHPPPMFFLLRSLVTRHVFQLNSSLSSSSFPYFLSSAPSPHPPLPVVFSSSSSCLCRPARSPLVSPHRPPRPTRGLRGAPARHCPHT